MRKKIVGDTENQHQEIVLYAPQSNRIGALLVGMILLVLGVGFLVFVGWQLPVLGASLACFIGSALMLILCWNLTHTPVLIINVEGIFSLRPMLRIALKWEEIDAIYRCLRTRTSLAFAVDLSPTGLASFFARQGKRIPPQLDATAPRLALSIPQSNLSLPVEQLLAQIREKFATQLELYQIVLDDRSVTGKEFR